MVPKGSCPALSVHTIPFRNASSSYHNIALSETQATKHSDLLQFRTLRSA